MFSIPILDLTTLLIAVKSRIHVVKSRMNFQPNFVRDFSAKATDFADLIPA